MPPDKKISKFDKIRKICKPSERHHDDCQCIMCTIMRIIGKGK